MIAEEEDRYEKEKFGEEVKSVQKGRLAKKKREES